MQFRESLEFTILDPYNQYEILTAVKSKLEFFESFSSEHMYSMARWPYFTRKERGMKWNVLFPFFSKQIWTFIPASMVTQYPMKGITIDNLPKQSSPNSNYEKFQRVAISNR